jgi:DNA-binding transcriptional LysR family regulator
MDEMNLNWEDLRLFLAVARAGGLSAAAQETGKSAPTLGRRMLALEAATGAELFRRLPRGYALTEQGSALLARVVDLEAQILPLSRAAAKGGQTVKVSAGSWMAYALCQNIRAILKGNETTRLRFISAEHELDIVRREAVIGIRNRRPEQVGLACRKIGRVQFAGYAISKAVKPWVRVLADTPSARWSATQADGAVFVEVSAPRNALDLACAGVARAVLPTFIGDAQGRLVRVTPLVSELAHEQWLVTHHELRFQPEVRRTIDRVFEVARSLHRRPVQKAFSKSD